MRVCVCVFSTAACEQDDDDFDEGALGALEEDSGEEELAFPLHAAVEAGAADAIAELMKAPEGVIGEDKAPSAEAQAAEAVDPDDPMAAYLAMRRAEMAREADPRPDVDARDGGYFGTTALQLALLRGDAACARALLDAGAEAGAALEGLLALHVAVAAAALPEDTGVSDALECVELLLEHGEAAGAPDDHGRLPLHLAAAAALEDAAGVLLAAHEAEGDASLAEALSHADREGNTPLHVAAYAPAAGVLKLLLEKVAPPAADAEGDASTHVLLRANKAGHTPLHLASIAGCDECRAALASAPGAAGAADTKDTLGRTPAECAAACPKGRKAPTLLVTSDVCANHHTIMPPPDRESEEAPPPDNVLRYEVLVGARGVLRTRPFGAASWAEAPRAAMADVLRVHDWPYVQKIRAACAEAEDGDGVMPARCADLDSDTAVSRQSAEAALHAVGGTVAATDAVLTGKATNAFVVARPPGHHAGPKGVVTNVNDPYGSHGFCLLNNVACGAAYALCCGRASGIKKVALLDFDVHHGNGTQACVASVMPQHHKHRMQVPGFGPQMNVSWETFKPWLDEGDEGRVFFASVQGFGPRDAEAGPEGGFLYPGSGSTSAAGVGGDVRGGERENLPSWQQLAFDDREATATAPSGAAPPMLNLGIPGPGRRSRLWRRAWRDHVLPALAAFGPDIIFVSAGFDAHRKDDMNCGYIGLDDEDYAWVTNEILKVANACCDGRVVSVLEGGYKIQGELVSPFARSVAAHVGALMHPAGRREVWSEAHAASAREREAREIEERRQRKEAAAAAAAAREAQAQQEGGEGGSKRPLEGARAEPPSGGRRRRGGAVDYVALAAKLDAEKKGE